MKSSWTGFQSPLGPGITAFLAHKRALGCLFKVEELSLRLVDRLLVEQRIAALVAITPDVVDAFLASRPRHAPRSYHHLRGTLARLFDWLVAHDLFGPSPVRAMPRRSTRSRLPFLFDDTTARRLLDVASQLPDWGGTLQHGPTYRVILTLLYGLGLRVGEVARLCVGDVDLTRALLIVRQTEFYKSRLVPFGPQIQAVLADQLVRRAQQTRGLSPEMPVFSPRRATGQRRHDQSDVPPPRAEARSGYSQRHGRAARTRSPPSCRIPVYAGFPVGGGSSVPVRSDVALAKSA
jgi:integrase